MTEKHTDPTAHSDPSVVVAFIAGLALVVLSTPVNLVALFQGWGLVERLYGSYVADNNHRLVFGAVALLNTV